MTKRRKKKGGHKGKKAPRHNGHKIVFAIFQNQESHGRVLQISRKIPIETSPEGGEFAIPSEDLADALGLTIKEWESKLESGEVNQEIWTDPNTSIGHGIMSCEGVSASFAISRPN